MGIQWELAITGPQWGPLSVKGQFGEDPLTRESGSESESTRPESKSESESESIRPESESIMCESESTRPESESSGSESESESASPTEVRVSPDSAWTHESNNRKVLYFNPTFNHFC